jgi:hypothetical protein
MDTLEALSRLIATTEDLQAIVRTMKSLSAVSIRQYERTVAALGVAVDERLFLPASVSGLAALAQAVRSRSTPGARARAPGPSC